MKYVVCAVVFLAALPVVAAPKRRAIEPLGEATLSGVVTDQTTGGVVVAADVVNGVHATQTDGQGKFTLKVPAGRPTPVVVSRSGYETSTTNVTASGTQNVAIQLKGKPTVSLKTSTNTTVQLDFESAQFAYTVPFSGYVKTDEGNFCASDGSEFKPHKSTIAKISGPATNATSATCCKLGPVKTVSVQLKSGTTVQSNFVDSCFGFDVVFLGRNHTTGQFEFFNFTNIAEIVFP
ncbi:MAG TPA: carboxypeptidase regulatory-like domain-containing protein [Thermoanaerobaculia bacterium]|nr:carboxypeptidase regulatory-like domain-containing protein [Thermoanaerobaculia bacterium]